MSQLRNTTPLQLVEEILKQGTPSRFYSLRMSEHTPELASGWFLDSAFLTIFNDYRRTHCRVWCDGIEITDILARVSITPRSVEGDLNGTTT